MTHNAQSPSPSPSPTPSATSSPRLPGWRVRRRRWATVLITMTGAVATWAIAVPVAGVDLEVHSGGGVRDIGNLTVLVTALVAGLAGWASLGLFERWTSQPTRNWRALAVVVYLASLLLGPTSAVTPAAGLVLAALHTVVAVPLIWALPRVARA